VGVFGARKLLVAAACAVLILSSLPTAAVAAPPPPTAAPASSVTVDAAPAQPDVPAVPALAADKLSSADLGAGKEIAQRYPNADSAVAAVIDSVTTAGPSVALGVAANHGLKVSGSRVRVIAEASDVTQANASIAASGATVEKTAGDLVQVLATPAQLAGLQAAPGIFYVRAPAHRQADAVTDEGVASTNAIGVQLAGQTGAGVKVAVIDLGFIGLAGSQASGDLPASLTTVDDCAGQFNAYTEHGTAVAEIVHKMAPDASLYLICIDTEVDLANAETYAKANGITIINHSVSWFNSSRGDNTAPAGSPVATVTDANSNGILWVNAAGNYATQHWSGRFINNGSDLNVFNTSNGDLGNSFWLSNGQGTCAFLKWDAWPTTTMDYDLYLVRSSDDIIVAGSENNQDGYAQAPTEATCYTNPDAGQYFFVGIEKYWPASGLV
jgi:hypothetical protein